MPAKPAGIDRNRFLKLVADHQNEVLVTNQRKAIAQALEKAYGRKMFKLQGRPVYEVDNRTRTRIHYHNGKWFCPSAKIQKLINRAIAGVKQ